MKTETVVRVRGSERTELRALAPAQPRPPATTDDVVIVSAYRLYLPERTDVVGGDQVEVRGIAHRVTDFPALRIGAALVVDVEQTSADATTFDCVVSISSGETTSTFNPATGQTETTVAEPVYEGPAAVTPVSTSDGRTVDAVDDQVDDRAYRVLLPAGAGDHVEVEHVVTVTAAPNADLVGCRLSVTSIARPGHEQLHELIARLFD